ncbi:MAG: bifunctional riboflavin kinase/FAD synthetase [Deltaproteobacteria bacterium]|nr:bifunctional riboflavin kinase/FAD synthetase [Deltaproteobacteria bacterium]MCB9488197.1 bifunctional riboflavin kinase/FAD synthetase [Deltaproteobacteria bacterium]
MTDPTGDDRLLLSGDGSVVTVGVMDSVHLGHQEILRHCRETADAKDLPVIAVTFDPHPAKVLGGPDAIKMIYPADERVDHLLSYGADQVLVQEFTREFAAIEPDAWAHALLVEALEARHLVVGYDFRFGKGAKGDVALLRRLGDEHGFTVEEVEALRLHGDIVSSSKIRRMIEGGEMTIARELMGAPYYVRGRVVEGAKRGRNLGFPTVNLRTKWELLPMRGVYAGIAVVDEAFYVAGVNVGTNPTFGDEGVRVEAHLDAFDGDLYGRDVAIHFLRRLRDETKFESVDALKAQMADDMDRARTIVGDETDLELRP